MIPKYHPGPWLVKRTERESTIHLAASSSLCSIQETNPRVHVPSPQSQSFSRSYGPILPTSLIYIILSTRGWSPWRPDAVMGTIECENKSFPRIFKDRWERTGHLRKEDAFPTLQPYLQVIWFHGKKVVKKKRQRFPGPPPTYSSSFVLPHIIHNSAEE